MKKIILASSSERKNRLFSLLGIAFTAVSHKFDEKSISNINPELHVIEVAKGKVESIKDLYRNSLIIGLDTVVLYEDKILEKPKDKNEALEMLLLLNGTVHNVLTGLCIYDTKNNKVSCSSIVTKMYFKKNSKQELLSYIEKENVLDIAGAYNHEELGCILLEKIDGDYYNSVGMPLTAISDLLKKFDVNVL